MSKKVSLEFKGLMAPVFTTFNDDERRTVQVDNIDAYAEFLKKKGIHGVTVHGTTGEGPSLCLAEKKLITDKWWEAGKKHDLSVMIQIGGAPLPDVIDMAIQAESLGVHSVLCLPELYFKPKTEKALVAYCKLIAKYCPSIPFLYYHFPVNTGMNHIDVPTFCDLAEAEIPNFVGIKFTSNDLHMGSACLKPGRNVFLGADTLLLPALIMGFDSAIMTSLNICPEFSINMIECLKNGKIEEAQEMQKSLTSKVKQILSQGNGDWVPSMKKAFNNLKELNTGPIREFYVH